MQTLEASTSNSVVDGIVERRERGHLVIAAANKRPIRRVLFVNLTGGVSLWNKVKQGLVPPHHLWGCVELARMGYEVALAEPLPNFYLYRNSLPHDLKLLSTARSWLGSDGIIYCGHNVLYWIPLLKSLGAIPCHVVSLLYAREPLDFSHAHTGVIALNPAAADHARQLAPKAKIAHLGWGVDLNFMPRLAYHPKWFLSCGITGRDQETLRSAAALSGRPIRVVCPGITQGQTWPGNVRLTDGGRGWNTDDKAIGFRELLHDYYAGCAASLIILNRDPIEYTAIGTTNLLEAMAMARPVIVTRTGALPSEIDVQEAGCGLHVPAESPEALAEAIEALANDHRWAQTMGERGRQLAESHYNMDRYSRELHRFFESL